MGSSGRAINHLHDSERILDALLASAGDDKRQIVLSGATVLSMDPSIGDFERADLLIIGRKIEAVEPGAGRQASSDAIRVDVTGTVIVPGFQDTHRHSWQSQLRRLIPNSNLPEYVNAMHVQFGPAYRPEDMYVGSLLTGLGAIETGVTTVLDHSHNARTADHSDAGIDGWADAGVRVVHAPCAPLRGAWDEQWPDDLSRLRSERFSSDDQLITLAMGVITRTVPGIDEPPGLPGLSAAKLRAARELDLSISVDGFLGPMASQVIESLAEEELLGPDMTYIHCQGLTRHAWEVIRESGGHVSLAPTSDAQIGLDSAMTPVQTALDFGIQPALSVDVECCLTTDMHSQMLCVLGMQRMMSYNRSFRREPDAPPTLSVREVLHFATAAGARANWLDHKVGTLTPGKEADLLVIRVDDVSTMPLNNAYGSVVLGSDSHNIESVFIAGTPRKWNREVVGLDRPALERRVIESRDYLIEAIGYPFDVLGDGLVRSQGPKASTIPRR